jgi:tetratricopeptide (TPR) repeat protein
MSQHILYRRSAAASALFFLPQNLKALEEHGNLFAVGAVILALILVYYLYKRSINSQRLLRLADQALVAGDLEKARKKYETVLKLEQRRAAAELSRTTDIKGKEAEGRAHLGLGRIHQQEGKENEAFKHFDKALKYGLLLPDTAIVLMGNRYAQNNEQTLTAIDVYLKYIAMMPWQGSGLRVYEILERQCLVEESASTARRRELIELNRQVLAARPAVEWAQYNLGIAYLLEGKFQDGVSHLEISLKLNPNRPLNYYWLGLGYLYLSPVDETGKAHKLLSRFLALTAENEAMIKKQAEAAFELGGMLINQLGGFDKSALKTGNPKLNEAITYFETAIKKDLKNGQYFFYLGKAHALNNDSAKAIDAFEKAVKLSSNNKEYLYRLAGEYLKAGLHEPAIEKLKWILFIDETEEKAHDRLSEVYLQIDDFGHAEEHCRSAIALKGCDLQRGGILIKALHHQGKFTEVIQEVEKNKSLDLKVMTDRKTIFFVADAYAKTEAFDEALRWFKQLPEEPEYLYPWGCALAHKGDYQKALKHFDKIITSTNLFIEQALLQRGLVYSKTGNARAAEEDFKAALAANPENESAWCALGCLHYHNQNFEGASACFHKLTAKNQRQALAQYGLGLIHERKGEIDRAIQAYEIALKNPDFKMPARLRLGILYCRRKDYGKALECFKTEELLKNDNDTALFYRGLALVHSGEIAKGVEDWKKLRVRFGDDERLELNILRARYLLGKQSIEKGKYDEAIAEWSAYLQKYTEDDGTKNNLAELHFRNGLAELANGHPPDFSKAKNLFKKAAELNSAEMIYQYYCSLSDFGLGKYADCIRQLNALGAKAADDLRVQYHLAIAMLKGGQPRPALERLKKLSANGAETEYSHHAAWIVANHYIKERAYDQALVLMEKLI